MAGLRAVVERLFETPGQPSSEAAMLCSGAAACHRRLLNCVAARESPGSSSALDALLDCLAQETKPQRTWPILNHPLLVEALHEMGPGDPVLEAWEDMIAPADPSCPAFESSGHGREKLNHVAWAFLLRRWPTWCGQLELCTDALGFLRFPFSDWSLWLRTSSIEHPEVIANSTVVVSHGPDSVHWSLASDPRVPFLVMARRDCARLVAANDPDLSLAHVGFPSQSVRPRLLYAAPLGGSGLRYEPVGFDDKGFAAHAGLTGAVIQALVDAIHENSPAIHDEMNRFLTAIRGYELPPRADQTLSSFSWPTLPGIMNINILYSETDQPLLNPFCFTWLGHELGHTKHYMIDDAIHEAGWSFLRNPADRTSTVSRYNRSLAVRTLFQIPYVHLYELALLTAFLEHDFAGLPWDVVEDPVAFGDDLLAEIRESFDLIRDWADVTPLGVAAVNHLESIFESAAARWECVRG